MEKYIAKTLDSLVNQTLKEIDILVINDGSTDKSVEVINEYIVKYSNVRMITKENGGISTARNCGLDNIESPYFGFVDSDDYVEPNMYEKMIDQISIEDCDICTCNFIKEWPDKQIRTEDQGYQNSSEMIRRLFATLWSKIYKTEVINKYDLKFPEGYRYEDACFLYQLAGNPIKITHIDDYMIHYVQRSSSITHTNNEKVKDMIEVFTRIKNYYIDHDLYTRYEKEIEFIFIKFFLGNNFLRACQIDNLNDRNEILATSWEFLTKNYPEFKYNHFLKEFGFGRRIYIKLINKSNYRFVGKLIHFVYKLKGSDTYD
jgi:hypothetical protein